MLETNSRVFMTLKKIKNSMPLLNTNVPCMLQSNIACVYQIQCSGCTSIYVGQTILHLQQRFKEHVGNKGGPVKAHYEKLQSKP